MSEKSSPLLPGNEPFNAKLYTPTGFQSPASGSEERFLDLNHLLVHRPSATFFMRMAGGALTDIGICDGDVLVVDRAVQPTDQRLVVVEHLGEFKVRILRTKPAFRLEAANPGCPSIRFDDSDAPAIFGVVTGLARDLRTSR